MSRTGLGRRELLRLGGLAGAALFSTPLLAACGGETGALPPPPGVSSSAATGTAAKAGAANTPSRSSAVCP